VYSLAITGFIYPVVSHWVWGGGWLSTLDTPYIDFAGSSVVHMVGGLAALAGAIILGPRIGKFGPDGKPRTILGHNIPFGVLGTLILLIGWYGFNPGSQLAADFPAVGDIALTTTLAGVAGAVVGMFTIWIKGGKPDVGITCNGLLAGLGGVTAGCAVVGTWGAIAIGSIAGMLVVVAMDVVERMKVDDPVGAFAVHGVCGAFGTLAVGLFAMDGGLFAGDGADQLVSQLIGVGAIIAWALPLSILVFLGIKYTIGLRVETDEELQGLDILEHGHPGYVHETVMFNAATAAEAEAAVGLEVNELVDG
jgi:Amt family ammonium transporter